MFIKTAVLAALASSAAAHATIRGVFVDGKDQGDGQNTYIRSPPNNSPVKTLDTPALNCNVNGGKAVPKFVTAAAGSKITTEWQHNTRGDDIIDGSHKGPVITYIAPYTSGDGSGAIWSKIDESGLSGGKWAVDTLIANKGKYDFTLPVSLKAGQYLVRQEIIALHEADAAPTANGRGAQFYPSCIQFEVTGSGSAVPNQNFNFNTGYTSSDPGIVFNLYGGASTYKVPGPAVWSAAAGAGTGSGAGNGAGNGGAAPAPTPVPTTIVTATRPAATQTPTKAATQAPQPTNPGNGNGNNDGCVSAAALYAQCGGQNFNGPTACATGSCKVQNPYYSQCVPN